MKIVGESVERAKLELLVHRFNLKSLTFTGKLNNEDLARIVSESWLNVHTSVTEGCGISIIEVAAEGTPTVAYGVPGVAKSIEDCMNGIKVKEGDRDALFGAVEKVISEPEKCQ